MQLALLSQGQSWVQACRDKDAKHLLRCPGTDYDGCSFPGEGAVRAPYLGNGCGHLNSLLDPDHSAL